MSRNHGRRAEDRSAHAIAQDIESEAHQILAEFCSELEKRTELQGLKKKSVVNAHEWKHFIATLARKALAGEHVETVLHNFTRLYVYPKRKATPQRGKV